MDLAPAQIDSEVLALAQEYAQDLDGTTHHEIFESVDVDLWNDAPELAARIAYARVQKHWAAQDVGCLEHEETDEITFESVAREVARRVA